MVSFLLSTRNRKAIRWAGGVQPKENTFMLQKQKKQRQTCLLFNTDVFIELQFKYIGNLRV